MTVRLMSRDPSNPTNFSIDTGYAFDGSLYSVSGVGGYSYQLKMLFDQSDNVESITYKTYFTAGNTYPGYYDNSGNWHEFSSNADTIYVSELNDLDYSGGIIFGVDFWGSYTTSQPASTPIPKIGSSDISKIYLGTEEISKIYLGSELVYEAEITPPTPIGDAYAATYDGSSWSSYTLKTDNDMSSKPLRVQLFSPDTSNYRLPWDGTGNLEFEIKVNLPTGLSSISNYILYGYYYDGSGTWSYGIFLDGYNVQLPEVGSITRTLNANTDYLLKVSLNIVNSTKSLYVKEIGVDSDYVLVQTNSENKNTGGTSSYVKLYNYGGSAPSYTWRSPASLEDIKVTANGTVLFKRS